MNTSGELIGINSQILSPSGGNIGIGFAVPSNMFLDTLLQYRNDVKQFAANVRFNLIHRPLSDFFVVYNESQLVDSVQTAGRGVVVKYTQMFSF